MPMVKLNTNACPVVMWPAGMGRSAVRFINLSRSFSIISLKPLAAAVTRKPPKVSMTQLHQSMWPCSLLPIKKEMEAENTTKKLRRSLTNFTKSATKLFNTGLLSKHVTSGKGKE